MNNGRAITSFLAVITIALLELALLAAAPAEPWASVLSSFEKVRPGAPFLGADRATLSAARGECEAFQLRVREGVELTSANASPLKGPGAKLSPRLFLERFVRVTTPSNGEGAAGIWPDPLVPLEGTKSLPARATADAPLVLFVELCVPVPQKPGRYTGALTLEGNGRPATVPISLEVRPFALPPTSSLPNTFGISIYSIAKGHRLEPSSASARELLAAYARSALSHRISLHGMGMDPLPARFEGGKATIDFRAYDAELGPFLDGTALPSGARFTTAEIRDAPKLESEERKAAYYAALREHFQAKRWPQTLFFYAKDEPTPADAPLVLSQARAVHRAGGVPVLVTSPLDEQLLPATDILAPVLNCFFPRRGPATCKNPKTMGELTSRIGKRRVFWYQSCMSHGCDQGPLPDRALEQAFSGWASYMIDHPVALNRAMGPLAYQAGVGGELYFATVYGHHLPDPWTDVFAFGGNGDGTLFYPGTPERLGSAGHLPVESLRLKAIRDGLEDYEYLLLLERLGDGRTARAAATEVARSGYEISRDEAAWRRMREKVGAGIEARWKGSEYARLQPVDVTKRP